MNIKILLDKTNNFILNRLTELVGILFLIISVLLFISLVTYSPEDPNFIYPNNSDIRNFLGFRGSFVSDIFYQSIGLISLLIPFSIFFTGINIFRKKSILILIENLFFIILYSIIGTLFFTVFHQETYWLIINGNNGFIGNLFKDSFFIDIINLNKNISYYLLLLVILIIFLLSINFSIKSSFKIFSIIPNLFKKNKNFKTNLQEENFHIPEQEEYKPARVQENFTFESKSKNSNKVIIKYKLPSLDFLKKPAKKERNSNENKIEDQTLEKILLDFGVEGKIKKISHGPVVTLYEFEPAPGVKVSKIINLSEDIARNTSSESARISIIPGSSTVGIELPKQSRENVYLSEIISNTGFA